MKENVESDLNKYFNDLSERHFRNMIYRFEDTIAHAGDKKYSITVQLQKKAISQLEIVGSKPFTTELRKQFLHFYKIDRRTVISELIPIIEELQNKYEEETNGIYQKRLKKIEKLTPFIKWMQRFSPKTQGRVLMFIFAISVTLYNIAVFSRLIKPFSFNLRFIEPMATEKDIKKIIKDLIRYWNTTRFITYANYKLNISAKEPEDIFESLGLQNVDKLISNPSKIENATNFMNKETFLEGIHTLIIENKYNEVFQLMTRHANNNTELRGVVTLLESRYNDNQTKYYSLGVVSDNEYSIEKNKIRQGILSTSNNISKMLPIENKEVSSNIFVEKKQEIIQLTTKDTQVLEAVRLFDLVDYDTQKVGNHFNKMELYVSSGDFNLNELKNLCQSRKKTFSSGTFLFVVLFDSIENVQFPSTPFTAMYGTDDNIMPHIKAIYTFNKLNGYSRLSFYKNNMYESIVNEFEI